MKLKRSLIFILFISLLSCRNEKEKVTMTAKPSDKAETSQNQTKVNNVIICYGEEEKVDESVELILGELLDYTIKDANIIQFDTQELKSSSKVLSKSFKFPKTDKAQNYYVAGPFFNKMECIDIPAIKISLQDIHKEIQELKSGDEIQLNAYESNLFISVSIENFKNCEEVDFFFKLSKL